MGAPSGPGWPTKREKSLFPLKSISYLSAPVSEIKSARALEAYLGYDEKAKDEAMEISE
jgi:hypothetical protein